MPRYVGSGDYYTFKSIMSTGSGGVGIRMPTAPMYQDKETYSGRNRVWLKSVRMGLEDADEWNENKSDSFMEIEMATASHNIYNGPMGNRNTAIAGAAEFIQEDQFTNATFWFAPTLYEYRNDNDIAEFHGSTIGTFTVAGAAIATGDTQNITYDANGVAPTLVVKSNRNEGANGQSKSIQLHYENDCYCPAKAVVVGQLWGTELDILLNMRPFRDNLQNNRTTAVMASNVYIEFVVEPLLNEHIPRHMEMEDEKRRMRY
tara:strand:+ start:239 stop:1018 length:780 start_codon:yes stop_codon:yes gene_type:complete